MAMKLAIIGFGSIGKFHCEQIKKIQQLEVAGIYDINPEKSKLAQSKGYKTYISLEECLEDDINLVIICTPNNYHKPISIKALLAGKHVICEKPAMLNYGELEAVLEVAKKKKLIFTVHQNRRWDKDFNIVKKALEQRLIGKPFYIESRVQGSRGIPGDWRCVKEAGGGMLLDWGVHLIDQLLILVDSKVTEIYAHLLNVKFSDVDDNFKIMMKFENNLSALIEVGTYTFIPLPRWHISTDEGTLVIENWDCEGKIIRSNLVEFNWEEGIVYTSAGPTKTMAPRPLETIEEIELPSVNVDCKDYYRNVVAAIEGREELIVTPKQSLRLMNIIDVIFQSATSGKCIKNFDIY